MSLWRFDLLYALLKLTVQGLFNLDLGILSYMLD